MKMKYLAFPVVAVMGVFSAVGVACSGGSSSSSSSSTSSSSSSGGGAADCTTLPTNTSTTAAIAVTSGTAIAGKFCSQATDTEYYWKLAGPHAPNATFHVVVAWDRGADADDVDFDVIRKESVDAGAGEIDLSTTGNCHAVGGTNEDCTATLDEATDAIYVVTTTNPSTGKAEGFQLTVTKN